MFSTSLLWHQKPGIFLFIITLYIYWEMFKKSKGWEQSFLSWYYKHWHLRKWWLIRLIQRLLVLIKHMIYQYIQCNRLPFGLFLPVVHTVFKTYFWIKVHCGLHQFRSCFTKEIKLHWLNVLLRSFVSFSHFAILDISWLIQNWIISVIQWLLDYKCDIELLSLRSPYQWTH